MTNYKEYKENKKKLKSQINKAEKKLKHLEQTEFDLKHFYLQAWRTTSGGLNAYITEAALAGGNGYQDYLVLYDYQDYIRFQIYLDKERAKDLVEFITEHYLV